MSNPLKETPDVELNRDDLPSYQEMRGILKPEGEDRWTQYRRISVVELRLCERSDDSGKVGVDYIARDPANPNDQWPMTAEEVRRNFKRI